MGVTISQNLSFDAHLKEQVKKLSWFRAQYKLSKMNLPPKELLNLWRTYLASKQNHQLIVLLFSSKTIIASYERKFLSNMKTSIGLVRSVSSKRLLALSDMLSPCELATNFLIRTTRKLISIGTHHQISNAS